MGSETREGRFAAAFVELADTLVADLDEGELLKRLVDTSAAMLDASAVARLISAEANSPAIAAFSSASDRLIDLAQIRCATGPTVRALDSGQPACVTQLDELGVEGAEVREAALSAGIRSIHAFPLRSRGSVIGVLTLLRVQPGRLSSEDASVAQGLADAAAIGIVHERALRASDAAQQRLQHALSSRVIIEQAKGVIAQEHGVDMITAFNVLRAYARRNNRGLSDVAEHVVSRELRF